MAAVTRNGSMDFSQIYQDLCVKKSIILLWPPQGRNWGIDTPVPSLTQQESHRVISHVREGVAPTQGVCRQRPFIEQYFCGPSEDPGL